MRFIETSVFTKQITEMIDDESYRAFQNLLVENPEKGKLIKNGGGIRKIRWKLKNPGKSGGVRIIYYFKTSADLIYFLYAYKKNEAESLTDVQISVLAKLVGELKNEK